MKSILVLTAILWMYYSKNAPRKNTYKWVEICVNYISKKLFKFIKDYIKEYIIHGQFIL